MTPSPERRVCTVRWGSNTIKNYGQLTLAECQAVGP
jgi:hypothetical protein